MASISMEGVRPVGCGITINNNFGGVNNSVTEFIDKLDSDTVEVDSTNGIDVKVSQKEDNILEKTETGLYASIEWEDIN